MNGSEKIEAAISPGGTPEIPVVICYEGIYIRDHWDMLCNCPWWFGRSPDLNHKKAWMGQVIQAIGQDWMYLENCWSTEARQNHRVVVEAAGVYIENMITGDQQPLSEPQVGGWEEMNPIQSGKTSTQWRVEPFAITPDQIDLALPPLPDFDAQTFLQAGHADLADWQLTNFGKYCYPIRHISTPLTDCYYLWGFEGMMLMVVERPDLVTYACERYLGRAIRQAKMAKSLGARGIWLEDCFTDMISPTAFEILNLTFTRQLVEAIQSLGMVCFYYFCGDPRGKLELILDARAEALALEESKKGFEINIEDVVDAVDGRCAVLGNLDAIHLLPSASLEELRTEIRRQIASGRKNKDRFIMSIGSPVTPGTTPDQVRLYCEITQEEGASA